MQNDPHTLKLPRSVADEVAASIPEESAGPLSGAPRFQSIQPTGEEFSGLEDADDEIQAAIRASLG